MNKHARELTRQEVEEMGRGGVGRRGEKEGVEERGVEGRGADRREGWREKGKGGREGLLAEIQIEGGGRGRKGEGGGGTCRRGVAERSRGQRRRGREDF